MARWAVSAIVLALLLSGAASVARADPTPSEIQAARDLFAKAEKDEDAGRWAAALEKIRRAMTVKPTPGLRFHLALCEEKQNQLVAALADYTAAAEAAREQNNKDVVDAVAEPLRLLRIRVPTLTLEVPEATGVAVTLDGAPIAPGLFGVAMPVEPGTHRVEARATGKEAFTTEVQLGEREAITTSVKWIAAASEALPQKDPFTSGAHEAPTASSEGSGHIKWGAIVMTASTVALIGLGIGAYLAADGAQSALKTEGAMFLPNACAPCGGMQTTVRAWDTVALVSWIAAAGTAALAIVLWASPSKHTKARLEVRPLGLSLTGSF